MPHANLNAARSTLKLAYRKVDYIPDPSPEAVRPFRLWNPQNNCYFAHRFYSNERRAIDHAYSILKWDLEIGQSVEVLDMRTAKWLATYTKRVKSIHEEQRDSDKAILARSQEQ